MFGRKHDDDGVDMIRSEEELRVDATPVESGQVRLRKSVEHERVRQLVTRGIEHADIERRPPDDDDSGEIETLEDGSLSIPVLEEHLVVTKQVVVRERIIVRKRTVNEEHEIEAVLRRERVDVDNDASVADRVHLERSDPSVPPTARTATPQDARPGVLPPPVVDRPV